MNKIWSLNSIKSNLDLSKIASKKMIASPVKILSRKTRVEILRECKSSLLSTKVWNSYHHSGKKIKDKAKRNLKRKLKVKKTSATNHEKENPKYSNLKVLLAKEFLFKTIF
jgi:hypothetical protein